MRNSAMKNAWQYCHPLALRTPAATLGGEKAIDGNAGSPQEHTAGHVAQIVTTAKIVKGS